MFFKFNPFSGRVTQSSQSSAYNPRGIAPHSEPPSAEIMFESSRVKPIHETGTATGGRVAGQPAKALGAMEASVVSALGPTASGKALGYVPNHPGYFRFMELQKLFTKDDHLLVWMKRGSRDMGPYYLTLGLCAIGMGLAVKNLIAMSFPKKNAD
ncbi:uncharacterized protein LOC135484976 [Lineus longissimus]|uniref:uncharacterized protein LOC135484976 n=1 Tax=Lineus longissimus TaxID=88925 RepID=UPI002B4CA94E